MAVTAAPMFSNDMVPTLHGGKVHGGIAPRTAATGHMPKERFHLGIRETAQHRADLVEQKTRGIGTVWRPNHAIITVTCVRN